MDLVQDHASFVVKILTDTTPTGMIAGMRRPSTSMAQITTASQAVEVAAPSLNAFGFVAGRTGGSTAATATRFIDNVTYTVVPESTSIALLISAPGLVAGHHRIRAL